MRDKLYVYIHNSIDYSYRKHPVVLFDRTKGKYRHHSSRSTSRSVRILELPVCRGKTHMNERPKLSEKRK